MYLDQINKLYSYFAAGCSTSSNRKIVAPSFVIVTSPMSSTSILSKPTGPRELFTMFAIDAAAITIQQNNKKSRFSLEFRHMYINHFYAPTQLHCINHILAIVVHITSTKTDIYFHIQSNVSKYFTL